MKTKIFFVFLTYSNNDFYNKHFLDLISKYSFFDYVIVNNAKDQYLNCGVKINEFYEFSGYQKGLELIKNYLPNSEVVHVIFLNDTIFSSHLKLLIHQLINKIIKYNNNSGKFILGIRQTTPILMKDIVRSDYFIPSYLFSLIFNSDDIDKLNLFNPNYKNINSLYKDPDFNNLKFINHINNWLLPKTFFGGWYQSNPASRLSEINYLRKKVTIFLEAKLLNILNDQKIRTVYISDDSKYLKFLMFLDRIYTIFLKLQLRISYYFLKVICG
jgi:hypothetical protein